MITVQQRLAMTREITYQQAFARLMEFMEFNSVLVVQRFHGEVSEDEDYIPNWQFEEVIAHPGTALECYIHPNIRYYVYLRGIFILLDGALYKIEVCRPS